METKPERTVEQQNRLVASLRRPGAYPHPVAHIDVMETHISWVLLTGRFAYKIKKAVDLGFLDFTTLERRRHYCEEELRLNRRWAPQLYLSIVPISGTPDRPSLGGEGEIIEYAVKMRQFPQDARLDRQLDDGCLREADMYGLAETIAGHHSAARVIEYANDRESVGKVRAPILENFAPVERAIDMELLVRVRHWTEKALKALKPVLIQRRKDGFVRECHGDLHLANLVRLDSGPAAFDSIEFSADLRNIDVLSDVAFLVMDLVSRARQDLAFAFLNRYLECTGDYGGMQVFGLYLVYHSMIRAKVAAIRSAERDNAGDRQKDIEAVKHQLAVAVRWINRPDPRLIAMHGYSGSGKTWLSSQLMTRLPAIRLRSDTERIRLFGPSRAAEDVAKPGEGVYTTRSTGAVYEHLCATAAGLLDSGFTVIVDAACLRQDQRELIRRLAASRSIRPLLISTAASEAALRQRLRARQLEASNVSEADLAVLNYQLETSDALDAGERQRAIRVATDGDVDPDELIKSINSFN